MDDEDANFLKCPPGYEENREHLPNFTIPLNDRTEWFTCFIKQLNDGRVAGLHSRAKGEEEAQIIELYASPDYSSDKPIEPLPPWLHHHLWGDRATYTLLKDAINDLDDWGLLTDVHQYHQYNQECSYIAQKLKLLEADHQSALKNHALIKEHLIAA